MMTETTFHQQGHEIPKSSERLYVFPYIAMDVHFKLGNNTDGVSLVTATMEEAVMRIDPRVQFLQCAGNFGSAAESEKQILIPELAYQTPSNTQLHQRIFALEGIDLAEQDNILEEIHARATDLYQKLCSMLREKRPGVIQIRNIFSMPLNIPATLAWSWVMQSHEFYNIKFFLMHHDFYWEQARAYKYVTPYNKVSELIEGLYPPAFTQSNPRIAHGVLNTLAEQAFYARTREAGMPIRATQVSDLIETRKFSNYSLRESTEHLPAGEFNWREFFGVSENDIMLCIPTRVVPRKAVELAIQLVSRLSQNKSKLYRSNVGRFSRTFTKDSNIVLVIPQTEDSDPVYIQALKILATHYGVDLRFCQDQQKTQPQPQDFYSIYGQADWMILSSIWEGFGNNWLETISSGVPHTTFPHPVYVHQLASRFAGKDQQNRKATLLGSQEYLKKQTLRELCQRLSILVLNVDDEVLDQPIYSLPDLQVQETSDGIIEMMRTPASSRQNVLSTMKKAGRYDADRVAANWWLTQVPRTLPERLSLALSSLRLSRSLLVQILHAKLARMVSAFGG